MSVMEQTPTKNRPTLANSSRRSFLKKMGIVGGGLVVGMPLTACANTKLPNTMAGDLQPNALLQITANNDFYFYLPRSEMGQGVYTGLTTVLAEELDVHPSIQSRLKMLVPTKSMQTRNMACN
ncbi:twin-arginine translocation signal domain-containing protein [Endozoicomonas sp. ONNA2]|uniref:twin-arginine translocation signal domain-containing protein n=1 Tax=Endozoicomonas sp. ONNA2 TaxID=2828741 RepID=UPI0021492360|nr:twin-arginine translocation signal domain-containing protein [Endozoicomonas sp. ONNA2]